MIEGAVNANLEAVVTLTLRGEAGQEREIEAVIDTGFNGFLTLPPALVAELGLPFASIGLATLADGSEAAFDVYDATVLWDGQPRYVESGAVGPEALVGMFMLEGHDLRITVWEEVGECLAGLDTADWGVRSHLRTRHTAA